jgi:DNA polymerase-3 subunit epsilon
VLIERLGGVLAATHARPRLVLAAHPERPRYDAVWLVGGRVADWAPLTDAEDLERRTAAVLRGGDGRGATPSATPDEVREMRIATTWLAAHPSLELGLTPAPTAPRLARLCERALAVG